MEWREQKEGMEWGCPPSHRVRTMEIRSCLDVFWITSISVFCKCIFCVHFWKGVNCYKCNFCLWTSYCAITLKYDFPDARLVILSNVWTDSNFTWLNLSSTFMWLGAYYHKSGSIRGSYACMYVCMYVCIYIQCTHACTMWDEWLSTIQFGSTYFLQCMWIGENT